MFTFNDSINMNIHLCNIKTLFNLKENALLSSYKIEFSVVECRNWNESSWNLIVNNDFKNFKSK